jgi:hypothetical protein
MSQSHDKRPVALKRGVHHRVLPKPDDIRFEVRENGCVSIILKHLLLL